MQPTVYEFTEDFVTSIAKLTGIDPTKIDDILTTYGDQNLSFCQNCMYRGLPNYVNFAKLTEEGNIGLENEEDLNYQVASLAWVFINLGLGLLKISATQTGKEVETEEVLPKIQELVRSVAYREDE